MQLSWAITLQIFRVKPGNPRREGGRDVMSIMKWVHNAMEWGIIGNPSEAG